MIIHKRNAKDERCIKMFNSYQLYTYHVNANKQALPVCYCVCHNPYSVYFCRVQLGYPNFFMVATKLSLRKKNSGNITERGFGSCEKALKKIGPRMGGAKK